MFGFKTMDSIIIYKLDCIIEKLDCVLKALPEKTQKNVALQIQKNIDKSVRK